MTVIYITFNKTGADASTAPWSYNNLYPAVTSPGVIKADLKDDSDSVTGISLTSVVGVTGVSGGTTTATGGAGGWPEDVFDNSWYFGAGGETHQLGGLTNGQSYTIEVAGHTANAARDTNFTIGTTTLYDNAGTGVPNPPISFSGTVSGTTLDIDMALVSTFGYVNGYKITLTASGPVITDVNTTNTVQVGDTPAVNGSNFLATGGTQSWAGENVGFSAWSDTVITSTAITRGDKAYDTDYDWIVKDNLAVDSAPLPVKLAIETGYQFVNLVNPINTLVGGFRTSLCYGSSPACATGDQLRVPLLTDQGKAIDISAADGTFVITGAGNTKQTFEYEIWDQDGPATEKWSLSSAVVVNGVIVGGGIVSPIVSSIVSNIVSNV